MQRRLAWLGLVAALLVACGSDDETTTTGADGGNGGSGATGATGGSGGATTTGGGGAGGGEVVPTFGFLTRIANGSSPSGGYGARFPIAAEPGGGYVIAFKFQQEVTVGSTTLTPGGSRPNVAIAALDASGAPEWAQALTTSDDIEVHGVAVDETGSIYLAGVTFSSTVSFGNGVSSSGSNISQWGFLAKFDDQGTAAWATKVEAPQGVGTVRIATRGTTLAFAGFYSGNDAFVITGPGMSQSGPGFGNPSHKAFVISIAQATGDPVWLERYDNLSDVDLTDVEVDAQGGVVASLAFRNGDLTDDDGTLIINVPGTAAVGAVVRLTGDAATSWSRGWSSSGAGSEAHVAAVAVRDGDVAVLGYYVGTADLGEGEVTTDNRDVFVTLLGASDGALAWTRSAATASTELPTDIRATAAGWVYVAGSDGVGTSDSIDGIPLPTEAGPLLVGLQGDGLAQWIYGVSGAATAGRIAIGAGGTIATLGTFSDATDFGTGTLTPDGREVYVLGITAD